MLVATFGPTTGWAGRTITYYDGRFTLEGHGFVTAEDVCAYDRQGHLVWAYDGLREWAYSLAPPPAGPVAVVGVPAPAQETPVWSQGAPAPLRGAPDPALTPATGQPGPIFAAEGTSPAGTAAAGGLPQDPAAPSVVQDLWRAHSMDFDARILATLAAGDAPAADVLAQAARCVCWDTPSAPDDQRRAFTLYDSSGAVLHTVWAGSGAALPEAGAAPAPPAPSGWNVLDAPWAAMAAPPGWIGGAPEVAAPAALAAMQARGLDWAAWGGEWLAPLPSLHANSGGQVAALLFAADLSAAALDDAASATLLRQGLDTRHSGMTLQSHTDDLTRRLSAGGLVDSVAYGTLAGRPASRIVAETRAGFPHGPRAIHIVQYVFMHPPYAYSLDFTVPSATPQRLGEADRCAATFVFKG